MKKDEGALRLDEAQLRMRRALDTEWQVQRRRLLNELGDRIDDEFKAAAVRGELLEVDDALLRRLAREQFALLPGADDVQG